MTSTSTGSASGPCSPRATTTTDLPTTPSWSSGSGPGKRCSATRCPARPEPYSAEATRAYVEGLLPEGPRRERIGRELGIDADRRLPDAGRAGPGLPRRGHLPSRGRGAAAARLPARSPGSSEDELAEVREAAPAALLRRRVPAADALRAARPAPQAQPRPRRGRRSLGLARGRRAEHARGQARDRRIPRIRRQRDVLHDRLPPGRHTGRESDAWSRSPAVAAWSRRATTASSARAAARSGGSTASPSARRSASRPSTDEESPEDSAPRLDRSPRAAERGQPPRRSRQPAHRGLLQLHPRQRRRPRQELRPDRSRQDVARQSGAEMAPGAADRHHLDRRLRRPDPPRPGDLRGVPGNVVPARTGRSLRRMRVRLRSPARAGGDHGDAGSAWRWRRSRRAPRRKAGTSRSSTKSSNSPPTAPSA